MSVADVIASIALIAGSATSLVAGIAVLRFPDAASRVHAATKPQLLGVVLLLIGLGIRLGSVAVIGVVALIVLLQMMTAPVAAHLAVREALRSRAGSPANAFAEASDGDQPRIARELRDADPDADLDADADADDGRGGP